MPAFVAIIPIVIGAANVARATQMITAIGHALRLALACGRPIAAVSESQAARIVAFNFKSIPHTIKVLRSGSITVARSDGAAAGPEAIQTATEMVARGRAFAEVMPTGSAANAPSMLQAGNVATRGIGPGGKVL